jgi:hypothetical protein
VPKKLEEALKRRARQLGYKENSPKWKAYVYGTIQKYQAAKKGQHA